MLYGHGVASWTLGLQLRPVDGSSDHDGRLEPAFRVLDTMVHREVERFFGRAQRHRRDPVIITFVTYSFPGWDKR